jgi:cell division protein FtsZ
MARRKRASMREGPLAALFRSTIEDDQGAAPDLDQRPEKRERLPASDAVARASTEADQEIGREAVEEEWVETTGDVPDPEVVRAYRGDEAPPADTSVSQVKERLSEVFSQDVPGDMMVKEPAHLLGLTRVHKAVIRVVGVGGGGVNAVNRMVEADVAGVEFIAINTDQQSLQVSSADVTVHIGSELTRGLGSGADPELGYRAAFEDQDKVKRLLKGSDMVFVTAGAGGGTGTGAGPVVARLAQEVGALTVGIVTTPFQFEGTKRMAQAQTGIRALAEQVDTLIVVPNEKLLTILERRTSMVEAFRVADDVLRQGVQGISDLVTLPGMINLDFADVRTVMKEAGPALLGIGMGVGDGRALFAAEKAITSPLLDTTVEGARSILLSITGGNDMSLVEVKDAAEFVANAAHPDANIIFGANVDEELDEQIWVTVIATRFDAIGRVLRSGASGAAERRREAQETADARAKRRRNMPSGLGIDVPEFIPGN